MSELAWKFRPLSSDGGLDYGNANVWAFDPTLDIFAREVTQNSVDAALDGKVSMTFRLHRLEGKALADFLEALKWNELESHLRAAADPTQKFGRTLHSGLEHLDAEASLDVLVIEERGAKGLVGAERGTGSNFAALCRNNLDSQKGGTAGGAFGLGKAVLWRMSNLSTVLFNSNLSEPVDGDADRQFGRIFGRSELAFHEVGEDQYSGPGWFGIPDDLGSVASGWGEPAIAERLLMPRADDNLGTSIAVLGFHDPSGEEDPSAEAMARRLSRAAARHFWPAIEMGRLVAKVEVLDGEGGSVDLAVNPWLEVPEYVSMLRHHRVDDVGTALEEPGDVARRVVPLHVPGREGGHQEFQHESILVVRRADPTATDGSPQNEVAYVRGAHMVVEYRSPGGVGIGARPFHAVALCGLAAEHELPDEIDDTDADRRAAEEFLRLAEPPSHTTWELTPDVKALYAWGAGARIKGFRNEIRQAIKDLVTPSVDESSEGPRDLKNLLRLGSIPSGEGRRPRVVGEEVRVDEKGRWVVRGNLQAPAPSGRVWTGQPAVVFNAETGGGKSVELEELTPVKNCDVDDGQLVMHEGKNQATFTMATDPDSHPVAAHDSSISLQFRNASLKRAGR